MKSQGAFQAVYQQENHRSAGGKAGVFLVLILSIGLCTTHDLKASWEPVFVFATYPPGCATVPDVQTALYGENAVPDTWNLASWPAAQPMTFGMSNCRGNNKFCSTVGWTFVLGNKSPLMPGVEASEFLTADQYNDSFRLEFNWSGNSGGYSIDVPASIAEFSEDASIPLSGRLSGLWVMDATSDQGFNIAVSELVDRGNGWLYQPPYTPPLLLFLSWYTFDSAGQRMWLTGSAEFQYGETDVSFPLMPVSGGEFMGDQRAERQLVGQVKIAAHNCNNLGFEYDLSSIGLGAGTTRLSRIFSLELAGHTCRDMAARIAANR